jgi:hypothetical protein
MTRAKMTWSHLGGGRARLGLGDADRGLVAGEHEVGGEALLSLGAVGHDRGDAAHVGLDDDAPGDAAALGDLGHHQRRVEEVAALPAEAAGDGHAEEARPLQRVDIGPGVFLGPVDLGGAAAEEALGEVAGPGLEVLSIFGQCEHARSPDARDLNAHGALTIL